MLANSETRRDGARKALLSALILFLSAFFLSAITIRAQQLIIPTTDSLPPVDAQAQSGKQEEEFINPARPGVSNPAELQKPGVLQIEYGYDGSFRASDHHTEQTAPLALRFAVTTRFLFELDLDTLNSQTDETGTRLTGIGDTQIGFQVVAFKDTEKHPALAFAYYAKLPTASAEKGLGTGRVDHKIITLLSKKFGETDMDFNAAYLIVGREHGSGWVTGGQAALAFERNFENNFGVQGELSGQTKDDVQPIGLYALGALTYKVNRRLVLDSGMRFGLTHDAPRVGVFAGMTIGLADFYRKKL
ncbi:MAG TPA: transporter [Pyrinomonadaceae bacterium]|nr:transporter [Pyrinomonadaceae bacterium]